MTEPKIPPPGHPDAVAQGCQCPIIDNGNGRGSGRFDLQGEPLYWINENCSIHVEQDDEIADRMGHMGFREPKT